MIYRNHCRVRSKTVRSTAPKSLEKPFEVLVDRGNGNLIKLRYPLLLQSDVFILVTHLQSLLRVAVRHDKAPVLRCGRANRKNFVFLERFLVEHVAHGNLLSVDGCVAQISEPFKGSGFEVEFGEFLGLSK